MARLVRAVAAGVPHHVTQRATAVSRFSSATTTTPSMARCGPRGAARRASEAYDGGPVKLEISIISPELPNFSNFRRAAAADAWRVRPRIVRAAQSSALAIFRSMDVALSRRTP